MRGLATPARAASRSTVERRSGASAAASSLAPTMPGATRSRYQYSAAPASSTQKTAIDAGRKPLAHQKSPPTTAQKPIRRSQALSRFRAVGQKPTELGVALVLGEAARGPVRFRRVAAARAVQRGDVLERDQDVAVELDVRDFVDGAVGGQDAIVVVAAEHGHLDLLALVLARVVLHGSEPSRAPLSSTRARLFGVERITTRGDAPAPPLDDDKRANHGASVGVDPMEVSADAEALQLAHP